LIKDENFHLSLPSIVAKLLLNICTSSASSSINGKLNIPHCIVLAISLQEMEKKQTKTTKKNEKYKQTQKIEKTTKK